DSVDEARAALQPVVDEELSKPITIVHSRGSLQTTPAALGAEVQVDRALARAEGSRHGFSLIRARLGLADTIEIPLTFSIQPKQVRAVVGEIASELQQDVVPATIGVSDDSIVVTEGISGIDIDQAGLFERLAGLPDELEIPLREVQPKISTQTAEVARARAERIVGEAPAVVYRRTRVKLGKRLLRRALRFERSGGEIVVSLDQETLKPRLRRAFASLRAEPRNAQFRVEGDEVSIAPSKAGTVFDLGQTIDQLIPNLGQPQVRAVYTRVEPDFTTKQAEAMGVREKVSEFTTSFSCCQPRVQNIQRAMQLLDGTIIGPGQTFSMNEALGPRTEARGFVPAPTIIGSRLEDTVGGGISQVATTLYNAAFFAGLQLVEHRPHSFYISRYPMGREATVSWGGPELVFRNDWDAAILIRAVASDTSITFSFYSSKLGRRIETATGDPRDFQKSRVQRIRKPNWEPGRRKVIQEGGIRGFTVTYTRQVYRGDELFKDESWTVRYVPFDTIVEVGPKPPKEKKPKETADGAPADESADVPTEPVEPPPEPVEPPPEPVEPPPAAPPPDAPATEVPPEPVPAEPATVPA
ncbi:MAG: VanW family protein, partial [Gaiellales bacterium]